MKGKLLSGNKGSALALVIVIFLALSVLGVGALAVSVAETKNVTRTESKLKAYYIARSGAQALADYLIENANDDAEDFIAAGMNDTWSSWNEQVGGGRFKVNVNNDDTKNIVVIAAIGEYSGVQQTVKIKLNKVGTGLNGVFSHAIVGVGDKEAVPPTPGITGKNLNDVVIKGTIASNTSIDVGLKNGSSISPDDGIYPNANLIFPAIVLPEDRNPSVPYNQTFPKGIFLEKKDAKITIDSGSSTDVKYIKVALIPSPYKDPNAIDIKENTLEITGSGIVHMYVTGGINLQTKADIKVAKDAKLYIYVTSGNPDAEIRWSGGLTSYENILLYAPDLNVVLQDAGGSTKFNLFGSIIGKTVKLSNKETITYNPDMKNFIDIGTSESKLTFRDPVYIEN